ncbi:MAG: tyrosine-type recombinase/integrase [Anaerolineales bacterium]|jgi:site-specific recombinase XerD
MAEMTLDEAFQAYLESVALSRSANTARTYHNALNAFASTLSDHDIDPRQISASQTDENWILSFIADLNQYAPATERLYLTAVAGWYEFLAAERLATLNLPRLRLLIRRRARRPGQRLPQFPRRAIETILDYAKNLASRPAKDDRQRLRLLRDRAFLLTLADTGLRVHEACALRRGDVDWAEARAVLVGKGDRQAVVRFSRRSIASIRDYLTSRAEMDGNSGRPLRALPLFSRHDKAAGKKVLPISTTTGRAIVAKRTKQALGEQAEGTVTPHSFRHYFVTTVLRGSGGNLKLAQELARHRSIAVTQRYAHLSDDELDRSYYEIFDNQLTPTD